jgi:hypothetical protein
LAFKIWHFVDFNKYRKSAFVNTKTLLWVHVYFDFFLNEIKQQGRLSPPLAVHPHPHPHP